MKTTKLKLVEVLSLNEELVGERGLLNQTLSMKLKYWLARLAEESNKLSQDYYKQRNAKIIELGTLEGKDKQPTILKEIEGKENPKYKLFNEQVQDLLKEEVELNHAEFNLDMFEDIKTENNYFTFFKLIEE